MKCCLHNQRFFVFGRPFDPCVPDGVGPLSAPTADVDGRLQPHAPCRRPIAHDPEPPSLLHRPPQVGPLVSQQLQCRGQVRLQPSSGRPLLSRISPLVTALTRLVKSLLDDIRAQRIPVDLLELFDAESVPFYEGTQRTAIR